MKNKLIFLLFLIIVGGLILWFWFMYAEYNLETESVFVLSGFLKENKEEPITTDLDLTTKEDNEVESVIEIEMENFEGSLSVTEIEVEIGDKISITFVNNEEENLVWRLDDLDLETGIVEPGQVEIIEFESSTIGDYEYYTTIADSIDSSKVATGLLIIKDKNEV
ncbi:MAG: cupredoxin domain-containing protein [Patescibacteria group bacterium]